MFRRKAKSAGPEPGTPEADAPTPQGADTAGGDGAGSPPGDGDEQPIASVKPPRPHGPWDVSELDPENPAHTAARLDLGGLRIRPRAGMKVQMQVDQSSGNATSVLLVGESAAVQLMVIAAAKSKPMWPQTKRALQSDADRKGGSTQDGKGPWGPVLRMAIPATSSDGQKGIQPTVVLGIDGPRWMLRATMIGKAAIDTAVMSQMVSIVQDTVVVRGDAPMAPGEVITLTPPARPGSATPIEEPDSSGPVADQPE